MIFYRFGEIPKNEKSCIWRGEEKVGEEFGVSVYEAHKNINGQYSPVLPMPANMSTLDTFLHFIRYYSGKKYLVTGDVLPFVGIDGEPLIKNVKILKELQLIKKLTSDEYIEKKIKDVLGDDMADGKNTEYKQTIK